MIFFFFKRILSILEDRGTRGGKGQSKSNIGAEAQNCLTLCSTRYGQQVLLMV